MKFNIGKNIRLTVDDFGDKLPRGSVGRIVSYDALDQVYTVQFLTGQYHLSEEDMSAA